MIKNVNDAYDVLMKVLDSLEKEGIEIKRIVPRIIREAKNPEKENVDTIEKYSPPKRLHWKKWRHVSINLSSLDTEHKKERFKFAREFVGKTGMRFDTGSGGGWYDWEIDWSFHWENKNNWSNDDEWLLNCFISFGLNSGERKEI